MQPKVSIIIPVYNVESFIVDCLQSVYRQTYPSIEVILIDDCSPDKSIEVASDIIQKLCEKFEVQISCNDQNRGLSFTRNHGVKIATGDYIYFLDSDDEISNFALEVLTEPIKSNQTPIDFTIGAIKTEGVNITYPLTTEPIIYDNEKILSSFMLDQWYVMGVNKLINRNFFIDNSLWFKEGLLHEDLLFSFQLASCCHTMATVNQYTYIYKIRKTGSITSSQSLKNLKDQLYINQLKFEALRKKYSAKSSLPIFKYSIKSSYLYLFIVASNKSLDKKQKKELQKQALDLFKTMKIYEQKGELDLSYRLKKIILILPSIFSFPILRLHKKIIAFK